MTFPQVTLAEWRAQVESELKGASFEKALVHRTFEGLAVQPLYTAAPQAAATAAEAGAARFRVCPAVDPLDVESLTEAIDGGADAVWLCPVLDLDTCGWLERGLGRERFLVLAPAGPLSALKALLKASARPGIAVTELALALAGDPLDRFARGALPASALDGALAELGQGARLLREAGPRAHGALLSTLAYHDAGADAADELALALSTGVLYLRTLLEAGLDVREAARQLGVQMAVGRDTFGELCKLRALRVCWQKLLAAAGAPGASLGLLHAVCSSRTLTRRDPWVNLLRVTTQVFAAALAGADLVTPLPFDQALGSPSALGQRVARNTGLVLRDESHLGRVIDPAAGSYYLDTLTDQLAREAWRRFQALEKEGGVREALTSGALSARLQAAWQARGEAIARRKEPITGVSEFAQLGEFLGARSSLRAGQPITPGVTPALPAAGDRSGPGAAAAGGLTVHREAEAFEALRDRAEALAARGQLPEVALVLLGPAAEHRARAGFASGFLAAGGLSSLETTEPQGARLACLCGSDERYASEAAARARQLKAAGCQRVLLAGRPGPLEAALREAGVDSFIFLGGDVVAALDALLGTLES